MTEAAPSGVHGIIKRFERRVPATYRLGRDPDVAAVPRGLARLLSAYERAPLRQALLILLDELPAIDVPLLWLARRGIFALARRPRGDDDPACDLPIPASGWAGSLLALGCWVAALIGLWLLAARLGWL